MLVKMRRQVFDSLEDTALGRACFEPVIPKIRGKDSTVKTQVYKQLSTGQKALFMFNAYYNHASNSLQEFYWWSAYFLAQPKAWSEIKAGLRYFKADAMLVLLEEMEKLLKARNPDGVETFDASYKDLDHDADLSSSASSLYAIFHEISPAILKRIGKYIRNNPTEFVQFES
ncbi:MAG TPA: hypothetical protein VNM45_09215 [Bacillus sp. (in: firmicutes)]|nr:hypothetical protein [Bacillus sp. (in: firmicutes)]